MSRSMVCNHAWFRRLRAERAAAPAHFSQNPKTAPSAGLAGRRRAEEALISPANSLTCPENLPGKGSADAAQSDGHPLDPDPWLCAKLDELHAAIRVRRGRGGRGEHAGRGQDGTAYGDLAALARVWVEWLTDAAGTGDPAARDHLRTLGFRCFDREGGGGAQS